MGHVMPEDAGQDCQRAKVWKCFLPKLFASLKDCRSKSIAYDHPFDVRNLDPSFCEKNWYVAIRSSAGRPRREIERSGSV